MKVCELIKWLEKFDLDAEVSLSTIASGPWSGDTPVLSAYDAKTGVYVELTKEHF